MCEDWAGYCAANSIPTVSPALIVQIEDGDSETASRTNLDTLLTTLEENIAGIVPAQIVHCLQENKTLDIGGRRIRYADPSSISADTGIRVVLFKMALTTGWDCPRAETMISFRRGQDATYIAQLVGRMVRTPLAERVHGNERLNDVYLFLPYFDEKSVEGIVERLTKDKESVPATEVKSSKDAGVLRVDDKFSEVVEFLRALPNYRVSQRPKTSNVRRLVKLSRLLSQDGIDTAARDSNLSKIVEYLVKHIEARLSTDDGFRKRLDELKTVTYRTVILRSGELKVTSGEPRTVLATERDVETLFSKAKAILTEDVAMAFWRKRHDEHEPLRAKVETYEIAEDETVWRQIETQAGAMLHKLFQEHRPTIIKLAAERRAKYDDIVATARRAESSIFDLPATITVDVPAKAEAFPKHLYINDAGKFLVELNTWEQAVLKEEMLREGFVCWLRNFDRKRWSMAFVYQIGTEERPGFPDFVVVRKHGSSFVADILEPHQGDDSVPKAKGLSRYAELHQMEVGRVEMIRLAGTNLKRLDFADPILRQKIAQIQTAEELDHLFDQTGS